MKIKRTDDLELEFDSRNSTKFKEAMAKFKERKLEAKRKLDIKKAPRIIAGFIVRSDYKSAVIEHKAVYTIPEPNWTNEEALKNFYRINHGLDPHNIKLIRVQKFVGNSFWIMPMFGGFYLFVSIDRDSGKHRINLRYRAADKRNWCIASAKVECKSFFLKAKITYEVKKIITCKKFFISDLTLNNKLPK